MDVKTLIEQLKLMPENAEVQYLYDGALRSCVEVVYLTKSGCVGLGAEGDTIYYDEDRPIDAPGEDVEFYSLPEGEVTEAEYMRREEEVKRERAQKAYELALELVHGR